jgi:LPS-assembly protein
MMISGRKLFLASSFLFSLLFFLPPSAFSQVSPAMNWEVSGKPIRLQADRISYDKAGNTYVAEGNVEIWQGNRKLTADRVTLDADTNEAQATGNVLLVQGNDFLRSDRVKIDLDTSLGIIFRGTLFLKRENFYIRGEEIERVGEDTYRVRRGSFTTCNGDWPAWRFTAQESLVTLEEYMTVKGATFEVKNVPFLYSPYLIFPVKTQRQSGFLFPGIGFSNVAGMQLKNAYFWAISKNMDATFYLDLATVKGFGEGLENRYVRKEGSSGSLYAYHARELEGYREKYTDPLDRTADRYLVELQHEEYFSKSFFGRMRLLDFSDREYFKDYGTTYAAVASEQAYSFASLTKNWERFSLYGEGRYTVDLTRDDKTTLQYLPTASFTGMKQRILQSPLYYSFSSSYGNFWRQEGVTGQVLDLYPRLTLPLKWGDLEFTPDLGGRETLYLSQNGGEQSYSRELWDFNALLATNFYHVFETGWSKVPKIKHLLRPEITYTYIPDVDQSQLPNFGTPAPNTNILTYSQTPNFIMPVPKTNTLTYALTQRFIGKVLEGPDKWRYHEYGYLKLSQTYDLNEANRQLSSPGEERQPFGPITAELRVRSLKYVTVDNITTYDPNKGRFTSSYTSGAVSDSRGDSFYLEYIWTTGLQEQINAVLRVKVLPSLDFIYGNRYSFFDSQGLETTYGLNFRRQCWGLDLSYVEKPGISGAPAQKTILFMFNLLGVTSVGSR